jgi:hypothetical protein
MSDSNIANSVGTSSSNYTSGQVLPGIKANMTPAKSSIYPRGGGTLAEHFTGREYDLINKSLKTLGAALIGLPPPRG